MKIKIRKSVPNDVYGIRDVQRITWLKTYPNSEEGITIEDIIKKFEIDKTYEGKEKIEERKKKYEDKNTGIWVAEADGSVVGFCMAIKEGEHNRVGAIYVLPIYHRKGLGGQLIEKAFIWLGDRKDILINVARYNNQAINFYNKFGFLETGKVGTLDSAAKLPSGKFIPEIELVKSCSRK
jgi:GNAT superfamily N-acetyltransferase